MSKSSPHGDRLPRSLVFPALTLFALTGLIACGGGSDTASSSDTTSAQGTSSAEARQEEAGIRAQLKRVEKKLNAIGKRAMQDTALRRRQEEVRDLYREAIREVSDPAARRLARLDTVRSELQSARAEGDSARVRSLITEMQELQVGLKRAREKAMEQEAVQKALEEYQSRVRDRMRELDPAADSLLPLADSLQRRVRSQDQGTTGAAGASDTAGG